MWDNTLSNDVIIDLTASTTHEHDLKQCPTTNPKRSLCTLHENKGEKKHTKTKQQVINHCLCPFSVDPTVYPTQSDGRKEGENVKSG